MKRCLIIGGAQCVLADVESALSLSEFDDVIVVKRMLPRWNGPVRAFVTLHPDTAEATIKQRKRNGYPMGFDTYCVKRVRGVQTNVMEDWAGSSGLFAVQVALSLGYDRIVLCGVPMDAQPHFDRAEPWRFVYSYRRGWEKRLGEMQGRVKSMSGWTRTLLGSPTVEWLGEVTLERS